jgi:hypothetical protein
MAHSGGLEPPNIRLTGGRSTIGLRMNTIQVERTVLTPNGDPYYPGINERGA